jgi:hypothetical protein
MVSQSQSTPVALAADVMVEQLISVDPLCTRLAIDPVSKDLFYLQLFGEIHRVDLESDPPTDSVVFTTDDHHVAVLQGLVFFDNKIFLVGDVPIGSYESQGMVVRGTTILNGTVKWDTVAYTEPYPQSNTSFDHGFSGITIDPEGNYLYVNSGSRTDHGEEQNAGGQFPGMREVPLTSAIFRIPSNAKNLYLPNDSAALAPYLYADGTRNSFDLAFNADGELFATENSGERDDPEELNWIREGKHYGFPWKAGGNWNPQQFPGYDPYSDPLLSVERNPAKVIYFHDDPDFPPMPWGLEVTDGIQNLGPDADYYRDSITGLVRQADDTGYELRSLSSHRSPLGLVFDRAKKLAPPYCGDAFMLSYQSQGDSAGIAPNNAPGTFLDPSEDLLHLELEKDADGNNYTMSATRIVEGFDHPVDAFIDGHFIYVIEISSSSPAGIWKITLPAGIVKGEEDSICLHLYPTPVENFADILVLLPHSTQMKLAVYDFSGNLHFETESFPVKKGLNERRLNLSSLPRGYYRLQAIGDRETASVGFIRK